MNIITLFLIGLSLSMDTFSLSLSLGLFNIKHDKIYCILVGIFHFIMPLLGCILSNTLLTKNDVSSELILTVVFFILTISMTINFFSKSEKILKISTLGLITLALSVSVDSFMIGLILKSLTYYPIIGCISFMIISYIFTRLGFYLGKKACRRLDKKAKLVGILIMFVLFFTHLLRL